MVPNATAEYDINERKSNTKYEICFNYQPQIARLRLGSAKTILLTQYSPSYLFRLNHSTCPFNLQVLFIFKAPILTDDSVKTNPHNNINPMVLGSETNTGGLNPSVPIERSPSIPLNTGL